MKHAGLLVMSLILVSCVYGPKSERKNSMSYLHGESYETSAEGDPNLLVVPLAKRKDKLTRIDGKAVSGMGIAITPIKNLKVAIYTTDGKFVSSVTTDIGGEFKIKDVIPNGHYVLKADSKDYAGEIPIEVKSYSVKDLVITVKSTSVH